MLVIVLFVLLFILFCGKQYEINSKMKIENQTRNLLKGVKRCSGEKYTFFIDFLENSLKNPVETPLKDFTSLKEFGESDYKGEKWIEEKIGDNFINDFEFNKLIKRINNCLDSYLNYKDNKEIQNKYNEKFYINIGEDINLKIVKLKVLEFRVFCGDSWHLLFGIHDLDTEELIKNFGYFNLNEIEKKYGWIDLIYIHKTSEFETKDLVRKTNTDDNYTFLCCVLNSRITEKMENINKTILKIEAEKIQKEAMEVAEQENLKKEREKKEKENMIKSKLQNL